MEVLVVFLRIILGTIFLTAGWSKIKKMEEHLLLIREYRLVPSAWVPVVGRLEIWLEVMVGVALYLGLLHTPTVGLMILLLVMYTIGIVINLLRGRREISCGCGGVVGNNQLSWRLVVRNIVLLLVSVWLLQNQSTMGSLQAVFQGANWSDVFNFELWTIYLSTVGEILAFFAINQLVSVRKRMVALFKG